jgi:hypothetical protein
MPGDLAFIELLSQVHNMERKRNVLTRALSFMLCRSMTKRRTRLAVPSGGNELAQLSCQTPDRKVNLAWVSFQPDGSISFGLNDRTYISPRFKSVIGVWSAYNRVKMQYRVASDPTALEPVQNPHFTYHPPGQFTLKEHRSNNEDALFFGVALPDLTVRQEGKMPWLRATTAPIRTLKETSQPRLSNNTPKDLVICIPDDDLSI